MELMKQIHLFKKVLVIFLKGATLSDFIDKKMIKLHTLRYPNPLSAILGDFFFG